MNCKGGRIMTTINGEKVNLNGLTITSEKFGGKTTFSVGISANRCSKRKFRKVSKAIDVLSELIRNCAFSTNDSVKPYALTVKTGE
jgi:hypothetical protein